MKPHLYYNSMDSTDFDAYNEVEDEEEEDVQAILQQKTQQNNHTDNNENPNLEMMIPQQPCTEPICYEMASRQCKQCTKFKCDPHLHKLCTLGPFCHLCYKRKQGIVIGTAICLVLILTVILVLLHDFGYYS
eukprot:1147450_1